ncbi:hypothetical protein VaNZ11_001814 [Volvox africanus]|uniref:Amino acid transporter n=1 Tax=Volvox africanus TaxID=51714 RepID=A0ABQ5RR88_9CHLO|nr:hypothetical protein VaNZ11_001814 [Volvox africanus]
MGNSTKENPAEAEDARLLFTHGSKGRLRADLVVPFSRLRRAVRNCVQHEPLLLATLAGVAVGIVLGVGLSFAKLSPVALEIIGLPGDLLMRTLKMLVLPLITASVMAGVCALRQSTADMGKVARYTLLYYFTTTMGAVVLGIVIVNIIRPGRGSPFDQFDAGDGSCHAANQQKVASHTGSGGQHNSPVEAFLGVIKSAFPDNIFQAAATMNVLGIITVSLLMGAALSSMGPEAGPMVSLINIFNDAIGKIVNWVIWTSPIGIASLITTSICRACNLGATLVALGLFILAVLLGLLLWGFIVLPAIYYFTTRRNPGQVYKGFSQAMATAFGTDSSNATLPITMRSAVAMGCDPRIVQFFLPLGTTVNMNGTALYEAVTVIFIAQAHGVVLGAAGTVIVALTATLAAVGAAGIPSAGLVTMLMVLQAVELEQFAGDIAIILAVDWFLDRCRTVVNVLGDSFGTVIIDHHARKWVAPVSVEGCPHKGDIGNGADGSYDIGIEMEAAVARAPATVSPGGGDRAALVDANTDADDGSGDSGPANGHDSSHYYRSHKHHHHIYHRNHQHGYLFHPLHGEADGDGVCRGLLAAAAEPAGGTGAAEYTGGVLSGGEPSVRHYLSPPPPLPLAMPADFGALPNIDGDSAGPSAAGLECGRLHDGSGGLLLAASGPMGHISGAELHHRHPHGMTSSLLPSSLETSRGQAAVRIPDTAAPQEQGPSGQVAAATAADIAMGTHAPACTLL